MENVPLVEAAAIEGEEDRIAPAHFGNIAQIGTFRPVDDIPNRTVAERYIPVQEPGPLLRQRQKRGIADLPTRQRLSLIGDRLQWAVD